MANVTNKNNQNDRLPSLGKRLLWADDMSMINKLIKALAVLCAVLLLLDIVIHRHSYFTVEGWFGFYPVAGFVAFTFIVVAARALRAVIGRDEAYYASSAVDAEDYPADGLELRQHPGLSAPSRNGDAVR